MTDKTSGEETMRMFRNFRIEISLVRSMFNKDAHQDRGHFDQKYVQWVKFRLIYG